MDVGTGAEDDLGVPTPHGSANPAEMVIELEAFSARTSIGSVVVGANLRTIISESLAFIHINAFLGIIGVDDVASIAKTQIASIRKIIAPVLAASASTFNFIIASALFMAASFVGLITTIVTEVTNLAAIDAIAIGTFEVAENVGAASRPICAKGHIILVRSVAAIIFAIANVVPRDAFEIVTLELVNVVASEGPTKFFFLIASVPAIIPTIAKIIVIHAQVVVTFEFLFTAEFSVGVPWTTSNFIAQIQAIAFTITFQFGFDAMTRSTLEFAGTSMTFASDLVTSISAIIVMIAPPTIGNTLVISALKFRFGTISKPSTASILIFVGIVSAIVFKVTQPTSEKSKLKKHFK